MTPEQEIARIKREYREHWDKLEKFPAVQQAIVEKNPTRLGEIAAQIVYGNYTNPTKHERYDAEADHDHYLAYKERERLIEQRKKKSN